MSAFFDELKGQARVQNVLIVLLILAYIFHRYQKRKLTKFFLGASLVIFFLCSTAYLPEYLTNKLERKYPLFNSLNNNLDTGKVLIHVLGSGYTLDKRLPANAQLGLVALGRLAEGIRVHRLIKNSVIICSGYSSLGLETQAQVTKRAAIVLGVDSNKLVTLNEPGTTKEEAEQLGKKFNKTSQLVIVTDAIHMPRAMKLFRLEGFNPIAAPTNYKVHEGPKRHEIKWLPSMENIGLMNYVIHEHLGNLKASVFR